MSDFEVTYLEILINRVPELRTKRVDTNFSVEANYTELQAVKNFAIMSKQYALAAELRSQQQKIERANVLYNKDDWHAIGAGGQQIVNEATQNKADYTSYLRQKLKDKSLDL